MSIEAWWPKLTQQSRDYLMENNGDEVSADLVEEITGAGGLISADAWWVGQGGPAGLYLSDEANDWIDEVANGETPEPGPLSEQMTSDLACPQPRAGLEGCHRAQAVRTV